MTKCTNCGYVSQPEDEYIPISPLECPRCGEVYGEIPQKSSPPVINPIKKICLNCGYERQPQDESAFTPTTECPKCHAIYEKVERWLLKKEYEKAEEWLNEKKRGQSQDGNLSAPQSSIEGSQESNDDLVKTDENYYNQGCNAFDAGYYENAIEKFTKAIQRDPSNANALASRGIAYRKLKRNIEATADLKTASLLGSAVAKDYFIKIRWNWIIGGTVTAIAAMMIIGVWQDNNEKNQREEMQKRQTEIQRQEVIAAEQARIKAAQERSAFQEEFRRELRKKDINDELYRRDSYDPGRELDKMFRDSADKSRRMIDESTRRMEMEDIARQQIMNDRVLHGERPY